MFRAMRTKQPEALKALLADPRTVVGGADGDRTLLGWAVAAGDPFCLEALLADGRVDVAGPILLSQSGLTCLHTAAAYGRLPVLRRLLRATRGKVPIDAVHDRGSTPLASAISVDWAEGARVLIEEGGADPMRRMADAVRGCLPCVAMRFVFVLLSPLIKEPPVRN